MGNTPDNQNTPEMCSSTITVTIARCHSSIPAEEELPLKTEHSMTKTAQICSHTTSAHVKACNGKQSVWWDVQEEFERKRGLFDDDLAFIREVKEQETAAAGMDPDTELQTLHKRFSNWKHEFKVSLYTRTATDRPQTTADLT